MAANTLLSLPLSAVTKISGGPETIIRDAKFEGMLLVELAEELHHGKDLRIVLRERRVQVQERHDRLRVPLTAPAAAEISDDHNRMTNKKKKEIMRRMRTEDEEWEWWE
jgi:hypothetical protein